jgi:Protein of unknown function (DUF2958)
MPTHRALTAPLRRGGAPSPGNSARHPTEIRMTLFTQAQLEQLKANCQAQILNNDAGNPDIDFKPVVKLFTPDMQCTWLLTELGNDDIGYRIIDLGLETPGIGFVCLYELYDFRDKLGLPIERDEQFVADKTLTAYAANMLEPT